MPVSREDMETVCIEQQLRIEAEPEQVYRALTVDIDSWWTHRFSSNGSTVSLEPVIGGRFQESFAGGGGALYGVVSYVDPDHRLTIRGPMGMRGAVASVITLDLEASGTGTIVSLSHRAIGEVSAEEGDEYSSGWSNLLTLALKPFVEDRHATV